MRFPTPLVLASGIWGTSPGLLVRAARTGAGAVTAKTCTPAPRRGHRNPTAIDWGHGLINAMGLPNPGAEEEVALLRDAARMLAPLGVPLIASIAADTVDDFGRAAAIVSDAGPSLIEVNISCPNVETSHGEMFASSAGAAAAVTRQVKASTGIPCLVKLSPNVADIAAIAQAVAAAGADGITAINTMPGMLVDILDQTEADESVDQLRVQSCPICNLCKSVIRVELTIRFHLKHVEASFRHGSSAPPRLPSRVKTGAFSQFFEQFPLLFRRMGRDFHNHCHV